MKKIFLLLITVMLNGCVIYPSRHVAEPSYEISISGESVESVTIASSQDIPEGSCFGGKPLNNEGGNIFVSEPEFRWLKLAFMVPVHVYRPIKICVLGKNKQEYYWAQNIGVMPNSYPKSWKFECDISKGILTCSKTT
jgi:hypothetical protein